MKQGSYFVNAARGELVDETALIDALTSGHLGGAGIDVVISQPLCPLPSLFISPPYYPFLCVVITWCVRLNLRVFSASTREQAVLFQSPSDSRAGCWVMTRQMEEEPGTPESLAALRACPTLFMTRTYSRIQIHLHSCSIS